MARTLTLMGAAVVSLDHAATILPANAKSASVLSLRERTPWEICTPSRACLTATICTRHPLTTCVDALAFWFTEVDALPTLLKDASSLKAKALATWSSLVPLWRWSLNRFRRLCTAHSLVTLRHYHSSMHSGSSQFCFIFLSYAICQSSLSTGAKKPRDKMKEKVIHTRYYLFLSYLCCSSWVNIDYNRHNSIPFNVIPLQMFIFSSRARF